jgi:uncharacterized protein (DUF488 family)
MALDFFTVGVYNSTESSFFDKLKSNNIDTFVDVRRRRGVRGKKYSYVNSKKLQAKLHELNIQYCHILDLAPTNDIRDAQKQLDKQSNTAKRNRTELGELFKSRYSDEVLSTYDLVKLQEDLERKGATNVVFFCVEEHPKACHRSLITDRLEEDYGSKVVHL